MAISFRWKTVIGIAVIECFFLFILIFNALAIFQDSHFQQIEQRAKTLARIFAAATTDSVISTDLSTLNELTEVLIANEEVLSVKVFGISGLLSEANKKTEKNQPAQNLDVNTYQAEEMITIGGDTYGRVVLTLDISDVNTAWETARRQSINIALLEIILVAIASLILGSYLTKQLYQLRTAISSIKQGAFEPLDLQAGKDDIGQTVSAFNDLTKELKASYDAKEKSITQTIAIANELSRREKWLQAVTDNIADGIITLDQQGVILSSNLPAQNILGYTSEELQGIFYDLIILDEEQRERIDQFLKRASHEHKPLVKSKHVNETGYRRDGTPFSMDLTLSFASFEGQDIFILLIRDLTEQKKIEQQALSSESIKSGMLDASLSAVIAIDEEDNILEFNPAAEKIFGYRKDEVLGKEMAELIIPARFRKAHALGMEKFLKTGVGPVLRQRIELTAIRKEGEEFPVELAITPINIGDEVVFTAVMDDITERLEATRKLEEAKESADQANKAKSKFLASMSHEIRTPLNVILGMVEIIKDTDLSSNQRSLIVSAENAGKNLLDIINDVLDLAKIEAGKMEARPSRFNPSKVIEDTVRLFSQQAYSKSISLHAMIAANVPAVINTDPLFFKQILINLLSNAIKYTRHGGVLVSACVRDIDDTQSLCIEVVDTGEGISKDKQDQVFSEFTQLHTVVDGTTGTGLGLVICRQLSELMGGSLSFNSELNKGSCFIFSTPLTSPLPRSLVAPFKHKSAIICSLDMSWRKRYFEQLSQWGVKVFECQQPVEVLPYLERYKGTIDFIVLDTHSLSQRAGVLLASLNEEQADIPPVILSYIDQPLHKYQYDFIYSRCQEPSTRFQLMRSILAALSRQKRNEFEDAPSSKQDIKRVSAENSGHILLVEDSEANRIIAETFLSSEGYTITEAVDGLDALEKVAQESFDLILMDMRMPNLGGVETTQKIRAQKLAENTPIIALTAHALSQEKQTCIEAGMQDFLTKPIEKELLIETVQKWIKTTGFSPEHKAKGIQRSQLTGPRDSSPDTDKTTSELGSFEQEELLIEKEVLQLIEDTNESAAKRMLNIFDSEARKRVASLKVLLDAGDIEQLETSVHALKSSAQTFGGYRLHLMAKQAEQCCKERRMEEVAMYCEKLPALVEQTLEALENRFAYKH